MDASLSAMGRFLSKCASALLKGLWFLCRTLAVLWGTLAIYYSNLPWAEARIGLAAIFAVVMVWALWYSRRRHMTAFAGVLFLCVVAWWMSISPSHDRNWRPDVAVMPRATIEGDRVRLSGVRNFDYRSTTDFTARFEEREVQLAPDRPRFLHFLFHRGPGRPYICQLHFRQRAAGQHFH